MDTASEPAGPAETRPATPPAPAAPGASAKPQTLGAQGEELACAHLEREGWTVLDRNWRGRDGEIDIVARDEAGTLVIVEVKTRSGLGFGTPAQAVTAAKFRRLRRLAAQWIEAHEVRAPQVRIDVIGVVMARGAETGGEVAVSLDHFQGVYR